MNPPSVYDETTPNSHNTKRITKIVQSIFHLHEFSFLPIRSLGRRANVAGCSLLNVLGNKDAGIRWEKVDALIADENAARSFLRGETHARMGGSPACTRGIKVQTACSA